jgi:uncharacterized protein (DUF2237 family)
MIQHENLNDFGETLDSCSNDPTTGFFVMAAVILARKTG